MLRMMPDVGRNKSAPAGVSGEVSPIVVRGDVLAGNARKRAYSGLRCVTSVSKLKRQRIVKTVVRCFFIFVAVNRAEWFRRLPGAGFRRLAVGLGFRLSRLIKANHVSPDGLPVLLYAHGTSDISVAILADARNGILMKNARQQDVDTH